MSLPTDGLSISSSLVKINTVDTEFRVITYQTKQFRKDTGRWEERIGRHQLPQASNIDIKGFEVYETYLLITARLPSTQSAQGVWYIVGAINTATEQGMYDFTVMRYLKNLLLG